MMKAAKPAFNVAARIGMSSEISCQLPVVDDQSSIGTRYLSDFAFR
jgi:hypothetical protein